MYDFTGRVAVVTGAGKGIGAAIAKRLFTDGAAGLALLDWDYELVKNTSYALDPNNERTLAIKCDVSSSKDVESAFSEIFNRFGKIDILVNNAGVTQDTMFHKMVDAQWDKVINVHLNGTYFCVHQVVNSMRDNQYGKIVNLSSTSAFGNVGQTNYAAAKAGIIGFTKTLARELGRKNITVNCIAPGFVDTDMIKTIPADIMEKNIAALPMQRLGKPEEIAALAAFLCSDESSYVSGECIICAGASYT